MYILSRFTTDAENVIARLEDERSDVGEEHDKQVRNSKKFQFCQLRSTTGVNPKTKAAFTDLCLWVLHSGQKSCHLFLGDHIHLLGHPGPVLSECNQLNGLHFSILELFQQQELFQNKVSRH